MKHRSSLLLADDEELIRQRVCMMLGDRFCIDQVDTAHSALEAAARGYDAILLDIVFPDGNGIEVCREIKGRDPHATVVISSSMETVDAWNDAFQAGADGYVEKRELMGLDPNKTVLMIENLIDRNRLRRQAEEVNRRQARLLSVLSHDVRAPFQALLGIIELLRRSDGIPEAAAENVETLYHCAKDQLSFISSLLDYLRLESGMVGLRLVPMDINLSVNQSFQGLRILAEKKAISVETDLQQDLPPIRGDLGRICQLVNNLVTNAIKFSPRGGRVEVTTRHTKRNGRQGVHLSVSDTGIGIRSEDRDTIFQPFGRGRDVGTEGERGTGLGLSICREIVQLHGGTLEIEAERPVGTAFTAWFPAEGSATDAASQRQSHGTRSTLECVPCC